MNNWSIFSKYRNQVFGLASISILIYHFTKDIETYALTGLLSALSSIYQTWIGYCGVEWFLFLSGMGLFFSFQKKPHLLSFYKRRLQRLCLPYILIGLSYWLIYDIVLYHRSVFVFLKDISFITVFSSIHHFQYWYICFIIVVYLMYPLLFPVCDGKKFNTKLWIGLGMIISGLYLFSRWNYDMYYHTHIFFARFMIFYIGALCSFKIYRKKNFLKSDALLFAIGIPLKIGFECLPIAFSPLIYRLVGCFWSLSLLFIVVFLMHHFHPSRLLKYCGTWSLELYMLHIAYRSIFKVLIYDRTRISFTWVYALVIVCTFASIPMYRQIKDALSNTYQRLKDHWDIHPRLYSDHQIQALIHLSKYGVDS